MKLKNNSKILVIHHWDCDGICSAALLSRYLKENNKKIKINFFLPKIGRFFLDKLDLRNILRKNPDIIFILDIAFSRKDILKLKKVLPNIYIFDHHKQKKIIGVNHINPYTVKKIDSCTYPSTGWIINDYFRKPQELLSALGAVGDQGEKMKGNSILLSVLRKNRLSFNELLEISLNIDSCYEVNDYNKIFEILFKLINYEKKIRFLLHNKRLKKNRTLISNEINSIVLEKNLKKIDNIIIKKITSNYNIISKVARVMIKKNPDNIIIIIDDNDKKLSNLYFRTDINIDLSFLLNFSESLGYNCGGKSEVVGVFVPKSNLDSYLNYTISLIKKNLYNKEQLLE